MASNWLQAAIRDEPPSALAREQRGSPLRPVPFSDREADPEDRVHEEFMARQKEMGAFAEPEDDPASEQAAARDDLERAVEEAVPAMAGLLSEVEELRVRRDQVPQAVVDLLDDILDFHGIDPTRPVRRGLPDRISLVRRYLARNDAVPAEKELKKVIRQVLRQARLGHEENWNPGMDFALPRPLGIPPPPPPPQRFKTEEEKKKEEEAKARDELLERVMWREFKRRKRAKG